MSVATAGGQPGNGSQSPSGSSGDENITSCQTGNGVQTGNGRQKVSSHYAQISPLRGQGLPHPSVMGIPQNTSGNNSVTGSPVKSYFQVIYKLTDIFLNTAYLTESYILFTLKMESVSKNTIFGLKMTVKSGLEKFILKSLHAGR